MKNVPIFILAGGLGTRLSEETHLKPKPMVEIGDLPILVHIMRWYYSFGFNDFVICGGYKLWEIKSYFLSYDYRQNHLMIDHRVDHRIDSGSSPIVFGESQDQENWRVRVIDTGVECMTGGRVARALEILSKTDHFENFAVTYGDGLSDVDLKQELEFHLAHKKTGTVLGVHPIARFGELAVNSDGKVSGFLEKPQSKLDLINGGFFFFKREFSKYLSTAPECVLERVPLSTLAEDSELMVHKHSGFWQPMDTLRDKNHLQQLWDSGKAPWRVINQTARPL